MAVVRQGCTPSDTPAPKWQPDVDYTTSTLVRFEDRLYQCVQSHKSQTDWPPTSTPALWVTPTPCGVTKWQDQTSYKAGSRVTYQGKTYQCLQAHTSLRSWEPPLTPALWKEVDPTTPDPDPTPTPDPGYTIAATFSTVGMYNQPATRLVVRPADPDALAPALRLVGVDCSNVSDATGDSAAGLLTQLALGDPLPSVGTLSRKLEVKGLSDGDRQGIHALVHLPEGDNAAAALFFVEQLDTKGEVVGGIAMLATRSGRSGKALKALAAPAPSGTLATAASSVGISASVLYRPYATDPGWSSIQSETSIEL
ncbi:hypothetical protein FOMG_19376 [Fusarium oxysporum f. sp. melonis 26406]|uniref:Chitin-binding type-3 domain-containing protein n=1 Tax=Fusarium oxysporum f. sp. melonis 26406 TaxID=1089452 RepID=W9Z6I0_FUSOX|nr:hypothetical protein FOMG_19376 [Fusarium oxysporum f. sp. melonis 26406]